MGEGLTPKSATSFSGWRIWSSGNVARKITLDKDIYTTKGRDRFHWAATPLKPYKVGNICYMTYRYSVLYFLNLSVKHFFPHRKRQFLWKYPNPETVIVPCLNMSRMPNRRTSQSKIEDIVHCKCISLLNYWTAYSPSTPRKTHQANPTDETRRWEGGKEDK